MRKYSAGCRNLLAAFFAAIALSGICRSAAFFAYAPDSLHNTFSVGCAEVELTEPSWDPENGKAVVPGRVIPKDPTVKNTGTADIYLFLEVKIPRRNVRIVDGEDPSLVSAAAPTDLFAFTAEEKWILMEESITEEWHTYLYGYEEILPAGAATKTPLFRQVLYANVLNGELEKDEPLAIPLHVSAIQAKMLRGISEEDGAETRLRKAFELYGQQILLDEEVEE